MNELTSQEDYLLEQGREECLGANIQDRDESVWADDPTEGNKGGVR